MRREQAKPLRELLELFIQDAGLREGLEETRVLALWDDLMGAAVARATQQKWMKNRKLYIRLNSSVVRNHLFMDRQNIVRRINQSMGKKLVDELILS